jgi:Rps23 Pro-64 3,4-dihydroxylase Tpa1-like proline 4-hydroxylase
VCNLVEAGYCVVDNVFSQALVDELVAEARFISNENAHWLKDGSLKYSGIDLNRRSDLMCWFNTMDREKLPHLIGLEAFFRYKFVAKFNKILRAYTESLANKSEKEEAKIHARSHSHSMHAPLFSRAVNFRDKIRAWEAVINPFTNSEDQKKKDKKNKVEPNSETRHWRNEEDEREPAGADLQNMPSTSTAKDKESGTSVDHLPPYFEMVKGLQVNFTDSAQFTFYPPERRAHFCRHVDNNIGSASDDGRRITIIYYLNPNWKQEDGGTLLLYPGPNKVRSVAPLANRLVMFFCNIEHEVRPTFADRYAVSLWLCKNTMGTAPEN